MVHTTLCDLLQITTPILQAGMGAAKGSPTSPALVASVSNAGGLGCLGATGLTPSEISEAIVEIQRLTDRPFGVGLLLPASLSDADVPRASIRAELQRDHPEHWKLIDQLCEAHSIARLEHPAQWSVSPSYVKEQADAVIGGGVPILAAGLGLPDAVARQAHDHDMVVMALAGSVRNAERLVAAGADVVIAQGHEAGGHTGTIGNFPLIPQVVDAVAPVPVVAAGGIADGRGLAAALALGAVGAWCGTAFLFAEEANIDPAHRQQLRDARSEQLVVSRVYTGKPARIHTTPILAEFAASGLDPLPMPHQYVLFDDFVWSAQQAGRANVVNNPSGQIAGMLAEIRPARDIVVAMETEADATIERMKGMQK
jgi:nitronate monooxygenase